MKTTIKSFLVAAVAATTLFSCSNEIENFEGVVPGNPGDVQISIGLGGGGATTYAISTVEKLIKNGSAMLYHKTTKAKIPLQSVRFAEGKFTATILAKDFTPNDEAQLCIYVNDRVAGDIGSSVSDTTTYDLMKAAIVSTPLNRELTNGIPASLDAAVTLKVGTPITGELNLKRVASRIGAVSTNATSINGYKVTLAAVNNASGKLFPGAAAGAVGNATVADILLTGVTTDMFGGSEAVGYVYPSINSSIIVTPPTGKGEPKTVNFAPIAGKNYTIKITPKVDQNGIFDNTVTIVDWDGNADIPVDLNIPKTPVLIAASAKPNFTEYNGGVAVNAGYSNVSMDIQNLIDDMPGALGFKSVEVMTTFAAAPTPTPADPLTFNTSGQNTTFGIAALANYKGPEVVKILIVKYARTEANGGDLVTHLNVYLKPVPQTNVEKLLVNIGGNLWMPFNTSGSAVTDEAIAGEILAMTTGANNTEKIVNYGYASVANQNKLQGKFFGKNITDAKIDAACPAGYRIAKMADWNALAGNSTMPTGDVRWCDGLPTEHNTVQQFQNSTLSRVAKPDIQTAANDKKRNFYYTFTAKAELGATAGDILPFIGNGWAYTETTTPEEILGGAIIWTGDKVGDKYSRLAVWKNGINTNNGPAIDVANIRCVKIK